MLRRLTSRGRFTGGVRILEPMSSRISRRRALCRLALLIVPLVVASACDPIEQGEGAAGWGEEAVAFFAGVDDAYRRADVYGVLDYYAPGAEVDIWRIDFPGGDIVDLLRVEPILERHLIDTHLADSGAVTLIWWPSVRRHGAVVTDIERGLISAETVLHDLDTLRRGARASPAVAERYEELFAAHAAAWSSGSPDAVAGLYAEDAVVSQPLTGMRVSGRDAIASAAARAGETWGPLRLASIDDGPDAGPGPALYLARTEFGDDPELAVAVFSVAGANGCSVQTAVRWRLGDGLIVDERRFPEVESFRECAIGELPSGWWTGLELPRPRDEIVTGTIETGDAAIAVRNGTGPLVGLVRWGLARFESAQLDRPHVASVTFEPTRQCDGVSGRVVEGGDARELFLCLHESDLCVGGGPCDTPVLSARIAVLHELAHAWMLDHLDEAGQRRVLEQLGLSTWEDTSVPWHRRGVEYSAEVLAWGLLDEPVPMVRVGDPPCPQLRDVFVLLTGDVPPRGAQCPPTS